MKTTEILIIKIVPISAGTGKRAYRRGRGGRTVRSSRPFPGVRLCAQRIGRQQVWVWFRSSHPAEVQIKDTCQQVKEGLLQQEKSFRSNKTRKKKKEKKKKQDFTFMGLVFYDRKPIFYMSFDLIKLFKINSNKDSLLFLNFKINVKNVGRLDRIYWNSKTRESVHFVLH